MNESLILDTNAYSDFARNLKWHDRIITAGKIFLPLMVVGELRSGFRNGSSFQQNESDLQLFLNQGNVKLLLPDLPTTLHYSNLFTELRTKGIRLPQNDLWIAALTLQHGLWLCTSDSHFDHIPQLLRASS